MERRSAPHAPRRCARQRLWLVLAFHRLLPHREAGRAGCAGIVQCALLFRATPARRTRPVAIDDLRIGAEELKSARQNAERSGGLSSIANARTCARDVPTHPGPCGFTPRKQCALRSFQRANRFDGVPFVKAFSSIPVPRVLLNDALSFLAASKRCAPRRPRPRCSRVLGRLQNPPDRDGAILARNRAGRIESRLSPYSGARFALRRLGF
jgi:hypothetical protein